MPKNFIITSILDKNKEYLKFINNTKIISGSDLIITESQYSEIKASLSIFGFNQIETGLIETLFARGYLQKIIGNEEKIKNLVNLGFKLDFSSILLLCNNSKDEINESTLKFEKLKEKLSQILNLGFSFNGESFCNILHIYESQIDRIIEHKEQLHFLHQFGVKFDLADWGYFNIHEEIINKLINLQEKIKLGGKIGLKILLKNLCSIKNTQKSKKELESIPEEVLSKLQAILGMKNKNSENDFFITEYKNLYNGGNISKREKPKKDFIFSFNEDSNNFNPDFLDTIDESIFDKALENIDLLSSLLQEIGIINIDIKDFLELPYLFDKPDVIKNIITLIDSGLLFCLNDFKNRGDIFKKLDEETTGYIIKMKSIHSGGIFDDITLIQHIITSRENLKTILENEEKYKKLVWLYKTILGSEEMLFKNGVFKEDIIEVLESQNFDNLEGIFQEALSKNRSGNEIFYPKNLALIIKITSKNPGDLIKFILTYLNKNFSIEFVDFLNKQNISDLRDFLLGLNKDYLLKNNKFCNEYIILMEDFGLEINQDIKNITYIYNIVVLLSGSEKPSNITSTNQMFNKLVKTGFEEGKISKDNLCEIGALIKMGFITKDNDKYGFCKNKLKELQNGDNIESYKKIIRALGDYMYSRDFEEDFAFQDLLEIFGKIFDSKFLQTLRLNTGSETFKYLLSKKVRLQDIERIYNNCPNIFNLNINNEYYIYCLQYAIENDNYDYLAQNIETIKYLIQSGFFIKITSGLDGNGINKVAEDLLNVVLKKKNIKNEIFDSYDILLNLKKILNFTGGYLTVSMIKGYIEDGKSLEELLQESIEAKKEVLSPNPITHLNLATYETVFLAYRPTGFTIESIRQNIENGNIADMSHHLEGIKYNHEGYPMEFFQRSYSLEGKQDILVVNSVNELLNGFKSKGNIFDGLNLKLFLSTATNIFNKDNESGQITLNEGIYNSLANIYALNNDTRIIAYRNNFLDGNFTYERLSELKEIFSVVTKDSFDKIIGDEISRLSDEEQVKLWENIGKIKDKNVKTKYKEINETDVSIEEKIKALFLWRLLGYASQIRKYLTTEMKKFKEVKGKETKVKAQLSKNIGSFFAKAGAGLCTSENYEMWKEQRHIHLNLIDEQRQEIIGNVMLYFEPGRNYLVVRGFNPRTDIESAYDVNHMVDEMIKVIKEIAKENGYVDDDGEALVYIPPQDSAQPVSNREKVRKRMKYIVGKVGESISDTKFSANREGVRVYNTLHRI